MSSVPNTGGASFGSLLALEKSEALKDFEGVIRVASDAAPVDPPPTVEVARSAWIPRRVVAIDGSLLTKRIQNGFPGAEASLLMLSVVFIDVSKLAAITPVEIPSPRIFNEMDSVHTLDAVLPGANVVRGGVENDMPRDFFRRTVFDVLSGFLDKSHETLLDTLRAVIKARKADIACPILDCDRRYSYGTGDYQCDCDRKMQLFETDAFRLQERFNEQGSNGEVHGEVKRVLEVLSLINVLRFFEHPERIHFLKDCAFVLDGPLAVFGQPAWLAPYVKGEIIRINGLAKAANGTDLIVIGVEKTGQYVQHFSDIDWTNHDGPKSALRPGTVIIPNARYVNRNIVHRPDDAKPSGVDTYFGRKVFYKTRNSAHAVLNMAIVNENGNDFNDTSGVAFPRLGDVLNIMDHLSTYLYQDGFMPLIRAHAHAAVPLRQGTEILTTLFKGG